MNQRLLHVLIGFGALSVGWIGGVTMTAWTVVHYGGAAANPGSAVATVCQHLAAPGCSSLPPPAAKAAP